MSIKQIGIGALVVVIAIVAIASVIIGAKEHGKWEADCKAKDGYVDKSEKTVTGWTYDSNGRNRQTTFIETTYYCRAQDGSILDVR